MVRKPSRGKWGTFLVSQREVRGWTQEQAFDALHEGLGLGPNSRSSYVYLERGTKPPEPDQQAFLIRFYGAEPPDVPEPVEDPTDLVAAISAQTAAITALIEELRLSRLSQVEATQVAFEALGALGAARGPAGRRPGIAREVPVGTRP